MAHYTEESADWQANVTAVAGTRLQPRVIYDPDGENENLTPWLHRVGELHVEPELRDLRFRGFEAALRFHSFGGAFLDRFVDGSLLYDKGWFGKKVEVWSRLDGPGGVTDRKTFTGFLRKPTARADGADLILVDQFAVLREMELRYIDEFSNVVPTYSKPDDPSNVQLDRTLLSVHDTTKSKVERWSVVFDKHPDQDPNDEYEAGYFYVEGDETGLDTDLDDYEAGASVYTSTVTGTVVSIPASAWSAEPDRGDRFEFLTTIRLRDVTPAEAIRDILENHSDLADEYIDTASLDAAVVELQPAILTWDITENYSILKILEILARHGLLFVWPNADGAVEVKPFAPEYQPGSLQVTKDVDLIAYRPDAFDDLYNRFEIEYDFDWKERKYRRRFVFPDDVGDVADDDGSVGPPFVPPTETELGNPSATKHGVTHSLELKLPGFTAKNAPWIRFVGAWLYDKYSDGIETGDADVKLHGLSAEPGDRFRLISSHPERDMSVTVFGWRKNISGRSVVLRVMKADRWDDSRFMFCDKGSPVSSCDGDRVCW